MGFVLITHQLAMTNSTELTQIWRQLTTTYQQMNSCTSRAEAQRLLALAEMLRSEYRTLTSNYR